MGKMLFGALLCVPFLLFNGLRIYKHIIFDRDVTQHLKRAADANSLDLAKQELKIVLDYCDVHNLKQGYTSILYTTPDEDIEFWYNNILDCHSQMLTLPKDASKDLILIKLHQTLLDHKDGYEVVTVPSGLVYYPSNWVWALWFVFSILIGLCGILLFLIGLRDWDRAVYEL